MFNNILMVCIGNICRSPPAEYLLKHKLAHKSGLIIHSAGLGALVAKPIDSNTGELLLANGVDASTHIARQVTGEMLLKADLILVMEPHHIKGITELALKLAAKLFYWVNGHKISQCQIPTARAWRLLSMFTVSWINLPVIG
jgi:protein-tyrosine phosphatase